MLNDAIGYAQRGWAVFPLLGKVPITRHGFKDASTDVETVVSLFAGTSYNIGISTGDSGLLVVDLDSEDAIRRWLDSGPTPTAVATTGRGQHWYYRGRGRSTAGRLGPGIDTRGVGGYVVAPPSIHPTTGGRYEWANNLPVADLPRAVADALDPPRRKARRVRLDPSVKVSTHLDDLTRDVKDAPRGCRNDALNRAAYIARGLGEPQTATWCLVTAGLAAGLAWEETTRTVASGLGVALADVLDWMETR